MERFKTTTGMISRKEMEDVINAGGSVAHKSAIITDMKDLPTMAELAELSDSPEDKAKALEMLKKDRENIETQIKKLLGEQMIRKPEIDLTKFAHPDKQDLKATLSMPTATPATPTPKPPELVRAVAAVNPASLEKK